MEIKEAIKHVADVLAGKKERGEGMPYCPKCAQFHIGPCPKRHCRMCGTEHVQNMRIRRFDNCERNETFFANHKAGIKWAEKETQKIWAQSDKDIEEE